MRATRSTPLTILLCVVVLVGSALPAGAAPGDPDRSFGTNGLVLSRQLFPGFQVQANAVAVQPDGKAVVVGHAFRDGSVEPGVRPQLVDGFAIARYTKAGLPDRSFGRGGAVVSRGRPYGHARDVAVQPDGRIVVVGGGPYLAVRRYLPSGRLDRAFPAPHFARDPRDGCCVANAVLVQPDRRIVVAGSVVEASADGSDLLVIRYRPDGSLDPSFGAGGVVVTGVPGVIERVEDLALEADGSIIAAGWSWQPRLPAAAMMLARLSPAGEVDPSLNPARSWARQAPGLGQYQYAHSVAIRPDGRILLAGWGVYREGPALSENVALVQYTSDGRVDLEFGVGGSAVISTTDQAPDRGVDMALRPDGSAVVVGLSEIRFGLVMRVLPDGSLDRSFGNRGTVKTALPGFYSETAWTGVALQPDGRIVAAGPWCFATDRIGATARCRFAAARLRG